MYFTHTRCAVCLIAFLTFFVFSATAKAQTNKPAPDQQTLVETLIQEVRQLRLTIERQSVTAFRAQIAVERLRAQHDVITRLNRDLEQVRQQLSNAKTEMSQFDETLEEAKKKFDAGLLPPDQFNEVKWHVENLKSRETALRERETALSNQLNTENGKMYALNQRLDMLEQVLESMQNLDSPPKEKKK